MHTKTTENPGRSCEQVALGFEETSMRIPLDAIFPLRIVTDSEDEVVFLAVRRRRGFKHLVRHDVLVRIASAARYFATDEIVRAQVGQHRDL